MALLYGYIANAYFEKQRIRVEHIGDGAATIVNVSEQFAASTPASRSLPLIDVELWWNSGEDRTSLLHVYLEQLSELNLGEFGETRVVELPSSPVVHPFRNSGSRRRNNFCVPEQTLHPMSWQSNAKG